MKYLGKFEKYEPPERAGGIANHLKNADGIDWYDYSWDKSLTSSHLFIGVNDAGTILNATKDGHLMFPVDLNVYAIENTEELYKEEPEDLYHGLFKDGVFTHKSKSLNYYSLINKDKKEVALKSLRDYMSVYQIELSLGTITDADKEKLVNYAKIYKQVDALDVNDQNMTIPDF